MRAGLLRERVTIESVTETRDAFGGVVQSWSTFATVWARVVSAKGDEAIRAAAEQAQHAVRFQLRWLDGVTPAMRLAWDGRTYDIRDVDESLRHRGELWITAVAKVA